MMKDLVSGHVSQTEKEWHPTAKTRESDESFEKKYQQALGYMTSFLVDENLSEYADWWFKNPEQAELFKKDLDLPIPSAESEDFKIWWQDYNNRQHRFQDQSYDTYEGFVEAQKQMLEDDRREWERFETLSRLMTEVKQGETVNALKYFCEFSREREQAKYRGRKDYTHICLAIIRNLLGY